MTQLLTNLHVDYSQVKKSAAWFNKQLAIMKAGKATPKKLLADQAENLETRIVPGSLYFFYYDPKMKDVLPFYDTFPMVFPYKSAPGGFLGLNLHYLPYPERFALFRELLKINGSKINDTTKIKYSWQMVNGMSSMSSAKHCIKHYLYGHVKSPFIKVAPADWTTSMLLPVEKFVGATKEQVWQQTRKK